MIPIFEPFLGDNEKNYILNCLDTNWISSQGKYIQLFETAMAEYHSLPYAIVTSSCTSALHLSIKALGIGPGDEVICPALTFIAPANMIVLSGAKLILVDIDKNTLTIDPYLIEKSITNRTKAIIVVHQFGHAAHMDEIMVLAEKYNLKVIEDNAESLGGKYKGKLLGTIGDISVLSFFGNKIITTGEGGCILTKNVEIAIKCREMRDHGMNHQKKYEFITLGYNYRMTNLQAAIGLAQIEKITEILSIRMWQMKIYYESLRNLEGLKLRKFLEWCEPVHWMLTVTLKNGYQRDDCLEFMKNKGVDCRPMIPPVHFALHFKDQFGNSDYPNAVSVSKRSLHLPSSTSLTNGQLNKIVNAIIEFLGNKIVRL